MADTLTPQQRSQLMARIRGKDTKIELLIRRALHGLKFRYQLHDRRLPGRPDMVLPKYRAVIFIHGCFWHGHDCALHRPPSSNKLYWRDKITRNQERDAAALKQLRRDGWRCLVIWECALRGPQRRDFDRSIAAIDSWLRSDARTKTIRGKPRRN